MSKKITQQDILNMAVNKLEQDMAADVDGDGKITPEDARLAPDGVTVKEKPSDYGGDSLAISGAALDRLLDETSFSYDPETDPLYRQFREMYEREGSLAAENAYGLAGRYTGGYGSSYAATAANDAYAMYMDKLAARGAELEQKAYDRAVADRQDLFRLYTAAREYEDAIYSRERDEEDDAYRDRQADFDDRQADLDEAYRDRQADRDEANDLISFAFRAAEQGDYSFLAALGVDVSRLEAMDEKERAEFLANYGDLSGLKDMGVDITSLTEQAEREKAEFYAQFGDLSGLTKLGVDVSGLKREQLLEIASLFAKYGDFSLLRMLI